MEKQPSGHLAGTRGNLSFTFYHLSLARLPRLPPFLIPFVHSVDLGDFGNTENKENDSEKLMLCFMLHICNYDLC